MILGIDPGKNGLALTVLWPSGRYLESRLFVLPDHPLRHVSEWRPRVKSWLSLWTFDIVAIEEMVYRPQRSSARGSSEIAAILQLQAIGALCAPDGRVVYGAPEVCKGGSIPKEIAHARLLERLDAQEIEALTRDCGQYRKSLAHNLLDSTLIAKWGAGK